MRPPPAVVVPSPVTPADAPLPPTLGMLHARADTSVDTSAPRVAEPDAPFALRAGTVIAGFLVTGINSDVPGEVVGQTSRDVFDSRTQQVLLIPRGSKLIGTYDNHTVRSGRLIVEWARLLFPDGRSIPLPRANATDETGESGLHDQVNHHYGRLFGTALLLSAFTAGVQLSQPQQTTLYGPASSGQVAAGAMGQQLGELGIESARRGLDTPPTITIRPGQPFNVLLTQDIAFDGPFVPDI
jgi:type IV secretion system protein VirB10